MNTSLTPSTAIDKKDWIAGLDKGLSILQTFDEHNPRLTATQAAQRCGLTRTAARRYLLTLSHLGYVMTDGKLFWLTPKVMRLGQSYLESARLPRIVQPSLQRLAMGTQEISFVAVLDGYDLVYIARNGQNRSMNTSFALGARVPCHLTSAGVLLLALLGEEEVDEWLANNQLKAFTSHTITDPKRMRAACPHSQPRLGAVRATTRPCLPRCRRAFARPQGQRPRRAHREHAYSI